MRISKVVLNFALMTCVAAIGVTSSASSSCNMRDGVPRTANTNPDQKTQKSSSTSVSQKSSGTKRSGKK